MKKNHFDIKNGFYHFKVQSKGFRFLVFLAFCFQVSIAQSLVTGTVTDFETKKGIPWVEIYNQSTAQKVYTNASGKFSVAVENTAQEFVLISAGYEITKVLIDPYRTKQYQFTLKQLELNLSTVVIDQRRQDVYGIKRLKDVEGTAIYAGKKTEVALIENQVTNKASGNPRQAYAQITGLNIYETEDAGLQLNIGGRGLDPNRSANFNTRQNGYDISADVLGYPESYYTPPLEALEEVQIVRGAASLQYGTQFGGLVNFKLKEPVKDKELEITARNGIGSFGLFNSFTSLSGTIDKFSYYTFFQYKEGDGFRPNSDFNSQNFYARLGYAFTEKTSVKLESTYFTYLAKQAGGISDSQFLKDAFFSNRERNYFDVDWILLNTTLEHQFSSNTKASLSLFGLNAQRSAVGFRTARTTIEDNPVLPRELLVDEFNNWGAEARLLSKYNFKGRKNIFLLGAKYYQSQNESRQGYGSSGSRPDFTSRNEEFINIDENLRRPISNYDFPNLNLAGFGEHIFKVTDKFSVTPGFRFEYIKTESEGSFIPISDLVERFQSDVKERNLFLLGIGLSYKQSKALEIFGNFSENYRSVTFNDIQVVNPSFSIDPNITDETGYTADIGVRGEIDNILRYDINGFMLVYDNRIGVAIDQREGQGFAQFRGNIGKAQILGIESLITANASNLFFPEKEQFHWQHFLNTAYTTSEYTEIDLPDVFRTGELQVGNELQFVPQLNLKTGLELGYGNFKSSLQYTYVSTQFTNADNTAFSISNTGDRGEIPSYEIVDFSAEYTYRNWKIEAGVNNVLDETYFTRRATGYPGPGIIPSAPRNYYAVLQFKF